MTFKNNGIVAVKVVRKINPTISLDVKKIKHLGSNRILVSDGVTPFYGLSKLEGVHSTATAFGNWLERYAVDKLEKLKPQVCTIKDGETSWTNKVDSCIYGLHFDVKANKVKFDERIGMKLIKKIVEPLGINVKVVYDKVNDAITTIEVSQV